jgi:hypothetical protein
MNMARTQIYRCMNRNCRREILVTNPPIEPEANPRCVCGAEMKRPYEKPTVTAVSVKPPEKKPA